MENGQNQNITQCTNINVIHVNEETGEVILTQPLDEYISEWRESPERKALHASEYPIHSNNQHTATSAKELKKLCSDSSRHVKGDTGYVLDFMMDGSLSKTESRILLHLCKKVIVWNYATTTLTEIQNISCLTTMRQTKNVWKSLCDKGMLTIINESFDDYGHTRILIQIHPKLYWEGRFSAWAIHANRSICASQYMSESYE